MSTKFEQLLDFLVNEEMDKANELFHEIVVDKSREIYENLIAEEEDEEADEGREEDDESVEEASEEEDESVEESQDEEADESMDLEDSYMMDGDDEEDEMGGDATDDFGGDIGADDDEQGHEAGEDKAIFDIKNAIQELEAAFAELEAAQGGEEAEMGFGDEEGEEGDDEMMGQPAFEGRRMTREYTEKVGHNYGSAQKTDGDEAGAGTGEKQSKPVNGKSPISSGSGKPATGANAGNILGDTSTGKGKNVGTSPDSLNKGIAQVASEKFAKGMHNVDGAKSGVKTLSKQGAGYPGNNKSAGPVGSGTGDKAGQTSVSSDKPFLKKL
jgi:hypothetical protein